MHRRAPHGSRRAQGRTRSGEATATGGRTSGEGQNRGAHMHGSRTRLIPRRQSSGQLPRAARLTCGSSLWALLQPDSCGAAHHVAATALPARFLADRLERPVVDLAAEADAVHSGQRVGRRPEHHQSDERRDRGNPGGQGEPAPDGGPSCGTCRARAPRRASSGLSSRAAGSANAVQSGRNVQCHGSPGTSST